MSAVEDVLKSLGLIPKDAIPWDPEDVRTKPFINQLIRNQMPNLTSIQRSRLLDRVGPHVASSLRDRLKGASQSKLIDIARDLSTNEKFKTQLNAYKSALETSLGVPLSAIDQGSIQADDQPSGGGVTKLRTRYLLPGPDTLKESPDQALRDIVNADMFDYRVPNEELGVANSLFLDNLRNDAMRFYDCSLPRAPEHLEELVAGHKTVPQFDPSEYAVEDALHDALKGGIIENGLMRMPPISLSLKDTTGKVDPSGLPRRDSYMIPVNESAGFKTVMQGTWPGYLYAMGFRPDYDPLRDPDQPSRLLPVVPAQSAADQVMQYRRDGSDYLWSSGYYPSIPRGESANLRGSQWIDA